MLASQGITAQEPLSFLSNILYLTHLITSQITVYRVSAFRHRVLSYVSHLAIVYRLPSVYFENNV